VRTSLRALIAVLLGLLVVSGCSSGSPSDGGTTGSTVVHIKIRGNSVTPNGTRIQVKVGQPVILKIDADQGGEIHVHSTPEQHIAFPQGKSTRKLKIKTPGIIDVEDHALNKVIIQLEVS
jgi:hypothetical protein